MHDTNSSADRCACLTSFHSDKICLIKDVAYKFKGIFARFTEYAGKADLNECY